MLKGGKNTSTQYQTFVCHSKSNIKIDFKSISVSVSQCQVIHSDKQRKLLADLFYNIICHHYNILFPSFPCAPIFAQYKT